jgi:uncharacterized protein (TIGR02246 family)
MADQRLSDEEEIRRRIARFAQAFRAKDIEGVISLFAPQIVSFDLAPPLQHSSEAYRDIFRHLFDAFGGPIDFEVRDLEVSAAEDVAFSHALNHVQGTMRNGNRADRWLRWTACFRKIDGAWLVVHEHVSVPADLASGKAVLDLKP